MKKKILKKWAKSVPKETLKRMIPEKLNASYKRPSFKDILAEQVLVMVKRSACLFYNAGTVIFKNDQILSFGYNGPAKGDVHCYDVGCSRIVNGELKESSGLCRGSHAELNAIGNAAKNGIKIALKDSCLSLFRAGRRNTNRKFDTMIALFLFVNQFEVLPYIGVRDPPLQSLPHHLLPADLEIFLCHRIEDPDTALRIRKDHGLFQIS